MELDNPDSEEDVEKLMDDFLERTGHTVKPESWEDDHNKKKCPECGGVHDSSATGCTCCGWTPAIGGE